MADHAMVAAGTVQIWPSTPAAGPLVKVPAQRRATRIVKDLPPREIAREIVEWIGRERRRGRRERQPVVLQTAPCCSWPGQAGRRAAGRPAARCRGGSKSLVDLSGEGHAVLPFMSHLNQIGQTGATPRHPKGLATCCHGEEPHVVGWRFVNERRAVNLDPNCGRARGKADVVYVADAFEVMAQVNDRLRASGD
ncbi:MAG TPA: hypothetical protein VGK32_03770 [Vicinamibacterales bacterium]|jgi:hypothetical protein